MPPILCTNPTAYPAERHPTLPPHPLRWVVPTTPPPPTPPLLPGRGLVVDDPQAYPTPLPLSLPLPHTPTPRGAFENRIRLPLEIVRRTRQASPWPPGP